MEKEEDVKMEAKQATTMEMNAISRRTIANLMWKSKHATTKFADG